MFGLEICRAEWLDAPRLAPDALSTRIYWLRRRLLMNKLLRAGRWNDLTQNVLMELFNWTLSYFGYQLRCYVWKIHILSADSSHSHRLLHFFVVKNIDSNTNIRIGSMINCSSLKKLLNNLGDLTHNLVDFFYWYLSLIRTIVTI